MLLTALLVVALVLGLLGPSAGAQTDATAPESDTPASSEGSVRTTAADSGDVALFAGGAATLHLAGRGWGHGVGMGQWGSLGYAIEHGWSYTQILDHYYGNTSMGTVPNRTVSVRLESQNGRPTHVYLGEGRMRIATLAGTPIDRTGKAMRFTRVGPDTFEVAHASSCAGPWTKVEGRVNTSTIRITAPDAGANPSLDRTLAVCTGGSDMRWYRGELRAVADPNGVQRTVNALPLEEHQRGVVPREVPASWGSSGNGRGMHALRAQSVAARTYTVAENRYKGPSPENNGYYAQTCDTTSCHVYGGRAVRRGGSTTVLENSLTDRAIAETAGQIRVRGGSPIYAQYSSSTGGHTTSQGSSSSLGWFPAVPDLGDAVSSNPRHRWDLNVDVSALEEKYDRGSLQGVRVLERNGLGADGGRVTKVRLEFTGGSVDISGNQFRRDAGLYSDWFTILGTSGDSDGGISCPADGLGSIQRLYSAYFLRAPDAGGMAYWADRRQRGWGLARVSNHFAQSSEFRNRYGGLSSAQFVDLIYENVMDRDADPQGGPYWVGRLERGSHSRGAVMLLFSDSNEYRRATGNCR